jgi:hypothetical protein
MGNGNCHYDHCVPALAVETHEEERVCDVFPQFFQHLLAADVAPAYLFRRLSPQDRLDGHNVYGVSNSLDNNYSPFLSLQTHEAKSAIHLPFGGFHEHHDSPSCRGMDTGAVQQHVEEQPHPSPLQRRGRLFFLLLISLLSACSDYSVREKLVLADSLSVVNADSSLFILNELEAETPNWKESDRLYFNQIWHRAKAEIYLRESPNDSMQRELLLEQERVLKASQRRSERVVTTIVAILIGLLLLAGLLIFRFVFLRKESERRQKKQVFFREKNAHRIATSPETIEMQRRCAASEVPSEDEWMRFQAMIDRNCEGFAQRLSSVYKLSTQELRVCLLIKANFKPSEIAVLTVHSKEAITSTRRRLYKKMTGLDGTPEMLDEFIRHA